MKISINTIFFLLICISVKAQSNCNCREIQLTAGQNVDITWAIDVMLNDPNVRICFDKDDQLRAHATYNGDMTLSNNQILSIRNYMTLHVSGSIILNDNASIIGENHGSSRINQLNDGATTIVTGSSTIIRDIQIRADRHPVTKERPTDVTGINVTEETTNSEISSVTFRDIETGMIVDGDGNNFYDLQFFNVATDASDCDPDNDDGAAIFLHGDSNSFVNLFHSRSPGAVTVWWGYSASNNELINISVEQEANPNCTQRGFSDPAIVIPGYVEEKQPYLSGNSMIENFNGAGIVFENPVLEELGASCADFCLFNYSAYMSEVICDSPCNGLANQNSSCH